MQLQRDDSVEIFKQLIQKVNELNYQQLLQRAQQVYAVRQFKLPQLSPPMALQIYQNISIKQHFIQNNNRFTRNLQPKSQLNWWENQLRIFVWTLLFYVHINSTQIQTLTLNNWLFFSTIFPHKQLILFEYQSINILREHNQAKKWTHEEDQIFVKLVHEKGLKCKWSELAKLLYIDSQKKYFRTPKQCRERWLNHLDPSKSKSQWSTRQDFILIKYVYQKQKRWAEISKLLQSKRNEHSIKNRFKSLITKELKFHKQKLTQKQLIESIYHRYKTHLSKGNNSNRIVDDNGDGVREGQKKDKEREMEKVQGELGDKQLHNEKGLHEGLGEKNMSMHMSNINNKTSTNRFPPSQSSITRHQSQHPSSSMYPFTWFTKQQSFTPYRKSQQQYFSFSQYQNTQTNNNMKRNFITTSYTDNMDGNNEGDGGDNKRKVVKGNGGRDYYFGFNHNNGSNNNNINHDFQQQIPQKAHKLQLHRHYPLPNQHYEPQNHFYSDLMLNQPFGSSSQIQLGSNYEQFLPVQQQGHESIEHHINLMNDNQMSYSNLHRKGSMRDDMDQEERKVRAEIFLLDNPIDVVRNFFYHQKRHIGKDTQDNNNQDDISLNEDNQDMINNNQSDQM